MKISRQTFIDKNKNKSSGYYHSSHVTEKDILIGDTWKTGGLQGGNCWGDEANSHVESDPEPNFRELTNLLMEYCIDIPWLVFEGKVKPLIRYKNYQDTEWYGNYTLYSFKYINLGDLYDVIEPYLSDK